LEASQYNLDRYTIERGHYITFTLNDWRKKTDTIKDIFNVLLQNKAADHSKPCIEWYMNDQVMLCMVKKAK
jgi:hypothetical protein